MDEKIEIGMRDVESVPNIIADVRNSFILYTNNAGERYIFSAFPEPGKGEVSTVGYTRDNNAIIDLGSGPIKGIHSTTVF